MCTAAVVAAIVIIAICYFRRRARERQLLQNQDNKGAKRNSGALRRNQHGNQTLALSTVSEKSEYLEYSQYSRRTRHESRGGGSEWRRKSGEIENEYKKLTGDNHWGSSSGV